MKIAYMLKNITNGGGTERVLCNKTNYLVKNGYDVTVITTERNDSGKQPFFNFSDKIKEINLDINYLDYSGKPLFIRLFAKFVKSRIHKYRLSQVLKREKFDVVVSMFDGDVRFFHSISDGSKKVAEIHFSKSFRTLRDQSSKLSLILNKFAMRVDEQIVTKVDKFVVLSKQDRADWSDSRTIQTIYNHIAIPEKVSTLTPKRAIAVGRLSYQKGFDMLVEAWAAVHRDHPDWHLDIYGGGDASQLQLQIDKLGLGGVITINAPTPDIYSKILESSIYLMTSRYEGLPMVLLEANACGVPAVSFACKCGPRDIISDGESGFLVEQDDIESFAERVCRLIEDEPLRKKMGESARKNAKERFSEEVVMKQWEELFQDLVKKE